MQRQIAQFLRYLQVERGASPHTLKGYREDLTAVAEYFAEADGATPDPASLPRRRSRESSPRCIASIASASAKDG